MKKFEVIQVVKSLNENYIDDLTDLMLYGGSQYCFDIFYDPNDYCPIFHFVCKDKIFNELVKYIISKGNSLEGLEKEWNNENKYEDYVWYCHNCFLLNIDFKKNEEFKHFEKYIEENENCYGVIIKEIK